MDSSSGRPPRTARRALAACSVAGAVLATAISAHAGSWSTPDAVSGSNVRDPGVAIDGTGTATMTWVDRTVSRIAWAQQTQVSGAWQWSSPSYLSDVGATARTPAIVASPSGIVTAVWVRDDGPDRIVQAKRQVGGTWSGASNLSNAGANAAVPAVATDPSGAATVVYYRANRIVATRWTGTQWSPPVDVSGVAAPYVETDFGVAVDASGVSTIAWLEGTAFNTTEVVVRRCEFVSGALSCGTPQGVSPAGQRARTPKVAVDSDGNAMVVWGLDALSGGGIDVQARRYSASSAAWGAVATISTEYQNSAPQVAAGGGVFRVLWQSNPSGAGSYAVQANRFNGSAWGVVQTLQSVACSGVALPNPRLAMTPGGVATAVWVNAPCPPSTDGLVLSARATADTWTAPTTLRTYAYPLDVFSPAVGVNANGLAVAAWYGGASTSAEAARYLLEPSAPTGVSGTRGNTQVQVTWTAPSSDGGSAITGYTVESSSGSGYATATTSACPSPAPTCAVVTGLTNGTAYTFRVSATNAIGTGAPSMASSGVTPATTPGAPTGLAPVTPTGDGQIEVTWAPPSTSGGDAVTGYEVTASPGGQTCVHVSGPLSCLFTGLTNGTAYTFTATATNSVGTGPASAPSASAAPRGVPGAPTGLTATPGNGQATVTWTAPITDGGASISGYTVTASPGGQSCAWTTGPLACTVTGLANGTPYTFAVTARNTVGTGPASSASAPVTPSATAGGGNTPAAGATPSRADDGSRSTPPTNAFTARTGPLRGVVLTTRVTLPGPGRVVQRGTRTPRGRTANAVQRVNACAAARTARRAGTITVACRLNASTQAARRRGAVTMRLSTTFRPAGGPARTIVRSIVLPALVVRSGAVTG